MNQYKVIERAIDTYGVALQKTVAVEEMSELIKEICKDIRGIATNRNNLIEEIADVVVMLNQLMMIYGITEDELEDEIGYKVTKLEEKLKEYEDESESIGNN